MTINGNSGSDKASATSPAGGVHGGADKAIDTALNYTQNARSIVSSVNEKQLLRKIDWRIIPIMFACYTMQFLDKVLINVSPLRHTL